MTNDYLMEKKLEYMLNAKLKKITEEFEAAKQQIAAMTMEIGNLKSSISKINTMPAPAEFTTGKEEVNSGQRPEIFSEPKKEVNSRTGSLTPSDVSIEKMFYFGNKR